MTKETLLALMAALGLAGSLAACNTVKGVGQDVQGAGEAVEDASEEVEEEIEEEKDD
jgi:predicted small secreted protein